MSQIFWAESPTFQWSVYLGSTFPVPRELTSLISLLPKLIACQAFGQTNSLMKNAFAVKLESQGWIIQTDDGVDKVKWLEKSSKWQLLLCRCLVMLKGQEQLTCSVLKYKRGFSVPSQLCLYNNDSALQPWLAASIEILPGRAFLSPKQHWKQLHVCGWKIIRNCGWFFIYNKRGARSCVQLTAH